jgi:nucleoside-diphosphate-sugar epimerase
VPGPHRPESAPDRWADYAARFGDRVTPDERIVITGGSGFIGTNLVELYREAGARVLNIDIHPPKDPAHAEHWVEVDVGDHRAYTRSVREFGPEVLLHLAARMDLDNRVSLRSYDTDVQGVENTLQAVDATPEVRRLIVTSSQLVCSPTLRPRHDEDYSPETAYGESKVLAERLTRGWSKPGCTWTIVRPTAIWGPWLGDPFLPFFTSIARRRYVHQRGVDPRRSAGFVGNTVYQYVALTRAPEQSVAGRTFYMADHEVLSVRDWADRIASEMGTGPIREVPLALLRLGGRLGDLLRMLGWRRVPLSSQRVRNLTQDMVQDVKPLAEVVGPLPYALEDAVRMTVEWFRGSGRLRSARTAGASRGGRG